MCHISESRDTYTALEAIKYAISALTLAICVTEKHVQTRHVTRLQQTHTHTHKHVCFLNTCDTPPATMTHKHMLQVENLNKEQEHT